MRWREKVFCGSNCFLISLVILVVHRLSFFFEPLGISVDESNYLVVSQNLLNGGIPYIDLLDRKPPGLYFLYATIGAFFGEWNIHGVHLVFSIMILLLAWLSSKTVKNLGLGPAFSAFVFATYVLYHGFFSREILSANAEYPMLVCAALALLILLDVHESRVESRKLFLIGLLAAFSFLFKQYGVVIVGFSVLFLMIWEVARRRVQKRVWTARLLFLSFGFAIGLAPVGLWFWSKGAYHELLRYSLFDGLQFVADRSVITDRGLRPWIPIVGMLASWLPLWIALLWALVKERKNILKDRIAARFFVLVFGGLVGSYVTVTLSGRYFAHYFIPVIWFLVPLGCLGMWQAISPRSKLWKRGLALLHVVMLAGFAYFNFDRESFSTHWAFTKERQNQIEELSDWIKTETHPSDRIQVWGMASQIYVASERAPGSRYYFSDWVSGRQPGYKSADIRPYPGAMDEFIKDLVRLRPKLIVDTSTLRLNDYGFFPIDRYPELQNFIAANYESLPFVAGFGIYRIR